MKGYPLPVAVAALSLAIYLLGRKKKSDLLEEGEEKEETETKAAPLAREACHVLMRKACLVKGGAKDHAGHVRMALTPDFDLDSTIFQSVDSKISRVVLEAKLGLTPFWRENTAVAIDMAFEKIPPVPAPEAAILDFMEHDCVFPFHTLFQPPSPPHPRFAHPLSHPSRR